MILAEKVAIVTGAGAGLGRAVAECYADEGAKVVVCEVDAVRGRAVVESIHGRGGTAIFSQTDVGDECAVKKMVNSAKASFGHVDILYNNAAVLYHDRECRIHDLSAEVWDASFRINSRGLWLCSKYVIPLMLAQGGGTVINVGSPTAINGSGIGVPAYSASKGAVMALSRVMALQYASDNIRVNCIVPGTMDTPMNATLTEDYAKVEDLRSKIPVGRLGKPEDVAGLALFLASPSSQYCTGGVFVVDGGLTAV
jgi:NAD(P)-dependent dehydrogenase (short-subunit alcohol dehydrogenase family)